MGLPCNAFLLLVLISITISATKSSECGPTACYTVKCGVRGGCGPGEVLTQGGYCDCCTVCKKVVGENECCGAKGDEVFATVICAEGLICVDKKCKPSPKECNN